MHQQVDSTANAAPQVQTATPAQVQKSPVQGQHGRPLTPYQAIKMLPPTATPEQQDSIVQHYFAPAEVHYNQCVDTLGLPGQPGVHPKEKNRWDFRDEAYYQDTLTISSSNRWGVAGDPAPYTLSSDNVITGLLLGCFILAMVAFSRTKIFLAKQAKTFFYVQHSEDVTITETTAEVRFQLFLVAQTSLLLSILYFFYTLEFTAQTFILPSQYHLLGIFFAIFIAYFLVKALIYQCVNLTFFSKKKIGQWNKALLFLWGLEGVLLFPIVMLRTYFDLSMPTVAIYTLIAVILTKILSISKCYIIFFRRFGVFLQIFLYFCALEIVPLLMLWGVLDLVTNNLKINF